jgi:hypothetical protein
LTLPEVVKVTFSLRLKLFQNIYFGDWYKKIVAAQTTLPWGDLTEQLVTVDEREQLLFGVTFAHTAAKLDDAAFEEATVAGQ